MKTNLLIIIGLIIVITISVTSLIVVSQMETTQEPTLQEMSCDEIKNYNAFESTQLNEENRQFVNDTIDKCEKDLIAQHEWEKYGSLSCTEVLGNIDGKLDRIFTQSVREHLEVQIKDCVNDDGIKVIWDKEFYISNETAVIQVIDKDMNLDSTIIDNFQIHVWSDADEVGIQLIVSETENASGIFNGNVYLTTTNESSGARLLVQDEIIAEYKENRDSSKIN